MHLAATFLVHLVLSGVPSDLPPVPEILDSSHSRNVIWISLSAVNEGRAEPNSEVGEVAWDGRRIEVMPPSECEETRSIHDHFGWLERRYENIEELLSGKPAVLRLEIVSVTPGFYTGMPAFMLQMRTEWMSESAFRELGWRPYFYAALLEGSFRQGEQTLCWSQAVTDQELVLRTLTVGSEVLYFPLHETFGHEAFEFVYREELVAKSEDGAELIPDPLARSSFGAIEAATLSELGPGVRPDDFD